MDLNSLFFIYLRLFYERFESIFYVSFKVVDKKKFSEFFETFFSSFVKIQRRDLLTQQMAFKYLLFLRWNSVIHRQRIYHQNFVPNCFALESW